MLVCWTREWIEWRERWGDDSLLPIVKYGSIVIPTVCRTVERAARKGNKPSARNGKRERDAGGCLVRERKESENGRLKGLDRPSPFG